MNKFTACKLLGIGYFLFDCFVQGCWIFIITGSEWIHRYSLHNSFILWCFAEGIFGETKFGGWIALAGILSILILSIVFCVTFFLNKNNSFAIPLLIIGLNIVFHIIFNWSKPIAYLGLLYKALGFIICALVLCKTRITYFKDCRGNLHNEKDI